MLQNGLMVQYTAQCALPYMLSLIIHKKKIGTVKRAQILDFR